MAGKKRPNPAPPDNQASNSSTPPPPNKKVKVVDAAKLRTAIANAIRDNPPGVRIVIMGSLDMTPLLAGYLNVPDTQALRDLINDITNSPEGKAWCEARKVGFGVNGLSETALWATKTLFKFASDPAFLSDEDFKGGIPLDTKRWPTNDNTRGYASWLVTMYNIIQAHPDSFPSSQSDETKKSYLADIHIENWHRAYHILRVIWREKNESRSNLKSTGVTKSKVQKKLAVTPTFFTDADLRGVSTEEDSKLTEGNLELDQYLEDEADHAEAEEAQQNEGGDEELNEQEQDEVFETFEASFKTVPTNLDEINKENWMPRLDETAKGQLLAHIGKQAKVLWPLDMSPTAAAGMEAGAFTEQIVQEADVEGVACQGEMDQKDRESFWEMQRTMNNVSSRPADYVQCCQDLDLDPIQPMIGPLTLKPWQVTGAWWILWQWKWGLGSALLSDDVGLGKTITALTALQLGAALASKYAKLTTVNFGSDLSLLPPYKPTLIVCPASAFAVWKEELAHFPKLQLHLWAGSVYKADVRDRYRTLESSPEALIDLAKKFPSTDPATACQVILTTYQTFHMRTLHFEELSAQKSKGKGRAVAEQTVRPSLEEIDDDDDQELSEEQMRRLKTDLPAVFGIIIADESHKLKSVRTRTHQAVVLALPKNILLITATPTINRSVDLFGSLSIIWRHLHDDLLEKLDFNPDEPPRAEIQDFENAVSQFDKLTTVNLLNLPQYIQFLYPATFLSLTNRERQLSISTAGRILPLILSLIQLRRVKGQEIDVLGKTVVIGSDIPPYRVTTIELEMSLEEYRRYLHIHERLSNSLGGGGAEGDVATPDSEGHINMAAHRLLSHASVHPGLDRFRKNKKASTAKVVTWNERRDYGYAFFHRLTRLDECAPPYRERVGAALSISGNSVKLQWLAGKVYDVCIGKKENLIVFVAWPTTQWLVEMFLTTVGVPVLSIRAAHSRMQRAMTQEQFNHLATVGHVLVTSLKCGATSMNLQKNCRSIVFLEVPESANVTAQAIGRVHRIGQTKRQDIYIVSKNHSYDQKLQAIAAQKMYGQIAGQSNLDCTDEEIDIARQQVSPREEEEDEEEAEDDVDDEREALLEEAVLERAQYNKVIALYMSTFGQRSPRHDWDDVRQLAEKDSLPSENVEGKTIQRKFFI